MILGLDCSTTVCGYAFFDKIVIDAGFLEIHKIDILKDKVFYIIEELSQHKLILDISEIKLEAPLSGFAHGKTSQQTIIKLIRFNAILEYILSEKWKDIPVTLVEARSARKNVLGKSFIKGMTAKAYVKQELPKLHPEIIQFEKLNTKNQWNKKNEDMYDAVIISAS